MRRVSFMETGEIRAGGRMTTFLTLFGAIILCILAGFVGSLVTVTGPGSWYDLLTKPSFNPPSWLFFPVWTVLYVLMGVSLFLVLMERRKGQDVSLPLVLFGIQLVLNVLWSFLFFYFESTLLGLAGIILLWIFIAATIVAFSRINRVAAVFLLPYIVWVSFAAVLNYALFMLNP
jgi:benzodiazapine receptor